jgi:hypothetical protein
VVDRREGLRRGSEDSLADLDQDVRIVDQVLGPIGRVTRGHEDRAIGLVDIADRDGPGDAGPPPAGRYAGDLALEEEVVADVVRRDVRQRARCQDLPSVWVDGA